MSDRGIKKWAPYKSLIEQTDSLRDLDKSMDIDEKPLISEDQANEINEILVSYHGQEVTAKYFKNKKVHEIKGPILKIDPYNKILFFEDVKVRFDELFYLSNN